MDNDDTDFDTTVLEQAVTGYNLVLENRDRLVRAYNDLGITLYQQGQLEQAFQAFEKVLNITPKISEVEIAKVYFNLGMVTTRQNDLSRTAHYLQQALEHDPNFAEAKLELLRQSYIKEIQAKNYQFTQDWFSRNLLIWQDYLEPLIEQPNLNFLEMGAWEGRATCWLLDHVLTHETASITCIDTFTRSAEDQVPFEVTDQRSIEARFDANIAKTGVSNKVQKIVGESQIVLRSLPLNTYDCIYIDGSHKPSDVLTDAILAWGLLKSHGIFIFDDYDFPLRDPNYRTDIGINAFLDVFDTKITILHQSHQVVIQKN